MSCTPAALILGCVLIGALPAAAMPAPARPAPLVVAQNKAEPPPAAPPTSPAAAPVQTAPTTPPAPAASPAPAAPAQPPQAAPPTAIAPPSQANAPARQPECMWLGQRVVSLLWRDDVNTAREQVRFYDRFGCPGDHLKEAFRCVIRQSEKQPQQTDINARIYGCWMSPEIGEPKPK